MLTFASSLATAPWHDGGFHWWFPLIPLAWFLLFLLFFGFVVRRLWWRGGPGGPSGGSGHSAEGVLGRRFAEGDIDEQEYRRRLEVLRDTRRR
jgi:putative membrane protein